MIRVVIGEDHAIVRSGLCQTLALEPDMDVVGEASDGTALLALVGSARPDVVLTDMNMPELAGLQLLTALRDTHPEVPVLVLSMYDHIEIVSRALRAGAAGYVSKSSDPGVLADALRRTAAGERFIAPELAQRMVLERATEQQSAAELAMSDREYQVLEGIARGVGAAELAVTLGVSTKTISAHKMRLMRKLGYTSTAQLVRFAMDRGIGSE